MVNKVKAENQELRIRKLRIRSYPDPLEARREQQRGPGSLAADAMEGWQLTSMGWRGTLAKKQRV